MESLSRPSHRRKHSAATNASSSSYSSMSFRSPYDDVLFSKGGKAKFEAHEYAEIFSGSSSIPVLDLSGLNDRVRSAASRSSKLDYSNIFGGLREADVASPYGKVFSGALSKTKTRIPADVASPFYDPGSVNSSRMTVKSTDASDQSNDGLKQQFNMSFSRTDQRNNNESNGKTHIAQLHAVPGFTHFVNENPHLQKISHERPVRPIKPEVSRTWSFSSGAEPVTVNGVIASEKTHIPDKSGIVNEINLKLHNLNDSKDLRQSSFPSFASKDDSKKTGGESSPPILDEELDENSVEEVSAAALKKAIDQAQESIRIAKMIMEKRKEGLKDGSKPRSKSHSKVKEAKDKKETRIHHVPDALKQNNVRVTYEKLDPAVPMVAEVYGKSVSSLSCSDSCLNVQKANKVETVRENIEVANDHRDAFTEVCKKFAPFCSESEMLTEEKVEVDNIDYSTCSSNNVEPCMEEMETSKETLKQSEPTVHQFKGVEIVSEMEESAPNSSQSVVEALIQCQATFDRIEGPESTAGWLRRILNCSESEQEQEKMINLTESNGVDDNKAECRKEFVEYEGLEKLTGLKFEFDNSQNGFILAEKDVLKQPDLDRKPDDVSEWEVNNQDGKTSDEIYLEVEVGIKDNVVPELEIVNKKLNSRQKSSGEDAQNEIADTHRDSSEYEAAESMQMETDNCSDIKTSEIPWDVDEVNDTHRGSRRSEENEDKFEFQVVSSENRDKSEFQVVSSEVEDNGVEKTIHMEVNETHRTNSFPKCTSEEKFTESLQNSTFKGLSSDYKCVNVDLMDAEPEVTLLKVEEMFKTDNETHNAADLINLTEFQINDDKVTEAGSTVKQMLERTSENHAESLLTSLLENIDEVPTRESQACRENLKDKISNKEDGKDGSVTSDERECVREQVERLHCEPKVMEKSMDAEREVGTSQNNEKNEENQRGVSTIGLKDGKRNDHNFETNERIEAIKRGREREKDKKAAERAIREARERAFAEAREWAEKARQRGMAEAQDKHDKASVENKNSADKVSSIAKLRAERAAVERATNEARERALEKAMSQKTYTEARTQAERFSSSSHNKGLKHSCSYSDLENVDGVASESAQRCKARLERHQRIMERAAKALAEKNIRDVLAQKEQAERNRLAESLDADIKRWATGKEGNLRALLSTLQYILGPDSGWQPVSLTDIITTAAVKKGYRKATLCVHPDKLQQRGATIHQKYICEKVFDLLKAAWNRFNSEER